VGGRRRNCIGRVRLGGCLCCERAPLGSGLDIVLEDRCIGGVREVSVFWVFGHCVHSEAFGWAQEFRCSMRLVLLSQMIVVCRACAQLIII
jgi:hypothetical protein